MEYLIIDVRNNGGGIVDQVIRISELMVPRDETIMITSNRENRENRRNARTESRVDLDIVILVNGHSASASEILAGALGDNNLATIIGTRTYGKGVMQEIRPLRTGGALKLTIQEFKTPNGTRINENGITPDIEIENERGTEEDEQLNRAIEFLRGI